MYSDARGKKESYMEKDLPSFKLRWDNGMLARAVSNRDEEEKKVT